MVAASQTHRELEFISPLGKDVLLLHKFEATEELGRPYNFELTLRSSSETIDFEELLGKNVSVRLDISGSSERFFNGYITKFSQGENAEGFATYYATISPWLWFLQKTNDCRIFQEENAVEIIEKIFQESGYADYELRLSSSYRKREYTVQYRESSFNFVSRLMEEEGIYYYFSHEQGHHTMIICDTYSSHEMIPAYTAIPYYPPDATTIRHEDIINAWKLERKVLSGAVALNDYDFKQSHSDIKNNYTYPKEHEKADGEIYDYPGKYITEDEGRHYARMRQEELHASYAVVEGSSTAREFTAGGLMKMVKHPRDDQNIEYLISKVVHKADQDAFGSTKKGASGFIYKNTFQVIESHTSFKAKSINIAPVVDGPQSAHVVGPKNEEIYCDEFGRVKVTFPWDRYSKSDENSSCWIRVSQNWAGGSWGHIAIPRIGQEVIVDFLEGNPDRPIITGRTYHDKNKVPYPLPANKTKMSIKSKTHKGKGYNELRFDDAKGAEQIFVHGEKDQDVIIKNNRREHIRNNRDLRVNNDRVEEISNDSSSKVDRDRSEATGRKYTTTVGEEQVIQVGKHYHLKTGKTQYLEAGKQIVIESGEELTIRSSGGFIKIDSSGITIQGKVVNVNTGGSPGIGIPVQASLAKAAMLATGEVSGLTSPDAPKHKPLELKRPLPSFTAKPSAPAPSTAVTQAFEKGSPTIPFTNNKLAPTIKCWESDYNKEISTTSYGRYSQPYKKDGTEHNYSDTVKYKISVPVKTGTEITVEIKIKVVAQTGVTAADVTSAKAKLKKGIKDHWTGKFTLKATDPAAECAAKSLKIKYKAVWVTSGQHYTMKVHSSYPREGVSGLDINVSKSTTDWTYAHEFAHCFGLPDEYSYTADTETVKYYKPDKTLGSAISAPPDGKSSTSSDATIMSAVGSTVTKKHHAWYIAIEVQELLRAKIGRNIECTIE